MLRQRSDLYLGNALSDPTEDVDYSDSAYPQSPPGQRANRTSYSPVMFTFTNPDHPLLLLDTTIISIFDTVSLYKPRSIHIKELACSIIYFVFHYMDNVNRYSLVTILWRIRRHRTHNHVRPTYFHKRGPGRLN
jgi:hypothetical protein